MRRRRDFGIFWLVQTLSVAGDMFSLVAVPLLVLAATGSIAQMGLLTAASGVGRIAAGLFAGVVADRFDRRRLLIGCDAVRAVLFGLIPIAWLTGPQLWLLYVVLPLGTVAGMLFQVTYVAAVPNLVDPDRITVANGRLSATYAVASIAGPMLAGLVSHAYGPTTAIAIDAATFALSALGLSLVRLRPATRVEARSPLREFAAGARFLFAHPTLRALTILLTLLLFLQTGLEDVFIYYLKHDLGRSDGTVGYVLAASGIGTVIAALLVARARRRLGFGACWIGANALGGIALVLAGAAPGLVAMAAIVTTFGFASTIGSICSLSLRQEVTPNHLLGRVTAAFWTIHYSLAPLGAAGLTAAAGRFGVPTVCLAVGTGCVLVALTAVLTPIRLARPEALAIQPA
jgi:MFS family permease